MKLTTLLSSSWILLVAVEPSGAAHKRHQEHRGERTMIQETSTTEYGNRILMNNDKKGEIMKEADDTEQGVQANPEQSNQVYQGVQTNAEQQNQADHGGPAAQEQPNQAVTDNKGVNDAATTTASDKQVVEGSVNDAGSNVEGGPTVGSSGLVDGSIATTASRPSDPKTNGCCECHTHKVPCLGKLYAIEGTFQGLPNIFNLSRTSCDRMLILGAYLAAFQTPNVLNFNPFPPIFATVSYTEVCTSTPVPCSGSCLKSDGARLSGRQVGAKYQSSKALNANASTQAKETADTNLLNSADYSYEPSTCEVMMTVKTESGVIFLRGEDRYYKCLDYVFGVNDKPADRPEGYDYTYEYPAFLDGKCCTDLAIVGGTGSFRLATGSVRFCWNVDTYDDDLLLLDFEGVCGCEENACCTSITRLLSP